MASETDASPQLPAGYFSGIDFGALQKLRFRAFDAPYTTIRGVILRPIKIKQHQTHEFYLDPTSV